MQVAQTAKVKTYTHASPVLVRAKLNMIMESLFARSSQEHVDCFKLLEHELAIYVDCRSHTLRRTHEADAKRDPGVQHTVCAKFAVEFVSFENQSGQSMARENSLSNGCSQ